jgi:hypothetical protein
MDQPTYYEIRLMGHLNTDWAEWFPGLSLVNQDNGEALLTGYISDQAALHGVLNRIRNLGLTLISVNPELPNRPEAEERSDENR